MGVDLDLDGLVTEAAPLDALRQRFGRVNRAGRPIEAAGAILTTTGSVAKRTDDPIYGDRLRNTWEALATIATREHVDFGVGALDQRTCGRPWSAMQRCASGTRSRKRSPRRCA